jgi:hypothetical protein
LYLDDGTRLHTDYAFLTVGHVPNRTRPDPVAAVDADSAAARARTIADPYPLPDSLAAIEPGQTVAVGGMGLSAMDVIAALTVGRGGRFVREGSGGRGGRLRYRPAGGEPQMLLHSRSGVPFRARPARAEVPNRCQPLVLTREVVAKLRSAGPLDFDQQLLPLLLDEMRVAYHRCRTRVDRGDAAEAQLANDFAQAARTDRLRAALDRLPWDFDPVMHWDVSLSMVLSDSRSYEKWLLGAIYDDLAAAECGLESSPLKTALEAVREVRDMLRDAINFGGLTNKSLDGFLSRTVPLMNRAVVGPQLDRHAELLALVEAGLLRAPFGPAPELRWDAILSRWAICSTRLAAVHEEHADWVCAGNAPWPTVDRSASPLIRSMHDQGRLRRLLSDSNAVTGADVDACLHPVDMHGVSDRRLWLIGPLCEGATFYNHLVPTPGYSRAFVDAHRSVKEMFELANGGKP